MGSIRAENITKIYPGTVALDNVSIAFQSGAIHGFVGKNGSGKSTLLKIFAGAVKQNEGKIYLDDVELDLNNPADACSKGIATVFQELSLSPCITVAENILLGRLPTNKYGLVNWKLVFSRAKELLDELKIDIDPKSLVMDLTVSQMQMVEIAKAMSFNPKVLLLDEPTSALSLSEAKRLFEIMENLKEKDVTVIFVTHRMQEPWDIADTCTVLRDGRYIGTVPLPETERRVVLHMMFGEVKVEKQPGDLKIKDDVVLEVKDLCRERKFKDISFRLRKGEILGIAGMLGSGRTELLRSIYGADPYDSGEIICLGKKLSHPTPEIMKHCGVAMVQEDRKTDGIIAYDSIVMNITMGSIDKMGAGAFLDKQIMLSMCNKQVDDLSIRLSSINQPISSLSGGNQQKVIIGRLLNMDPKLIIFDEPTRGIDVATKQQIFRIIWDLSKQGISSLIVSSELEELIEVCTRIIIMRDGHLCGEVGMDNLNADDIYLAAMGEEIQQ